VDNITRNAREPAGEDAISADEGHGWRLRPYRAFIKKIISTADRVGRIIVDSGFVRNCHRIDL
jgi:hypothetical protein